MKTTLIYIDRDRVVRADFSGRSRAPQIVQRPRPDADDPDLLLGVVSAASSAKLGRVFVLAADLWTHVIELPMATTAGMSPDELASVLGFEAEPLSGVAAFDAAVAAVPVGSDGLNQRYWTTVAPGAFRDQLEEAVQRGGGKLAGLCHPAGLPTPLAAHEAVAWRRWEAWPGLAATIACHEGTISQLRFDAGHGAAFREDELAAWRGEGSGVDQREALLTEGFVNGALTLADESTLSDWLTAWRTALNARRAVVPLITVQKRPMSSRQRSLLAFGLAVLAVAACWGHSRWVEHSIQEYDRQRVALNEPREALEQIKKDTKAAQTEQETLQKQIDQTAANVEQVEQAFVNQRKRLAELLAKLSAASGDRWALREITGNPRELTLTGLAVHPEAITALASELAEEMTALGWSVDPPLQKAENHLPSGAPWRFAITLRDVESSAKMVEPDRSGSDWAVQLPQAGGSPAAN